MADLQGANVHVAVDCRLCHKQMAFAGSRLGTEKVDGEFYVFCDQEGCPDYQLIIRGRLNFEVVQV